MRVRMSILRFIDKRASLHRGKMSSQNREDILSSRVVIMIIDNRVSASDKARELTIVNTKRLTTVYVDGLHM